MTDYSAGIKKIGGVLPFPRSISPEAQAALRRLVGDDGVPVNSLHVMPSPDDRNTWLALKAAAERHYAAFAETIAGSLRSQVKTIMIADAVVHVATPVTPTNAAGALVDLHGGAFVFGEGEASRISARMQADQHSVCCYGIDYRMPPEHPYPAALDDCLAAYRYVLDRHEAANVIISGRSAGGNLAVSMLLRARHEGLPFPSALVLLSPEVDLTESGDSFEVNRMVDVVLPGSLMNNNLLYAAGADLSHPYLSPLFGNLSGFHRHFSRVAHETCSY